MSVNEILAYLEVHYWVMIIIFLVSMLVILRLFYKNLNKENLEDLIKKNPDSTFVDAKLEKEESFSSSKKPFEIFDNLKVPEVEMEIYQGKQ